MKLNEYKEKLEETNYDVFVTDSPSDLINYLKSKDEMVRIFIDESVPVYLAGIGYETIHLDMIDTANRKGGFELKYNYKDPKQICLIYVPFTDETFDEEGDAYDDNYTTCYGYDKFDIYSEKDFSKFKLYNDLGKCNITVLDDIYLDDSYEESLHEDTLTLKNKILDKLQSMGYNCSYRDEGWYYEDGTKVKDDYWEEDSEPTDDMWYVENSYYHCDNESNKTSFSWRIDDSKKEFVIIGIFGNYEGTVKGFATKTLDEVLSLIPTSWTINIENNINSSYWNHIRDKYPQYDWEEIWESLKGKQKLTINEEVDADGNKLSKEQINFFKNSVVRQGGKLLPVYHSSYESFNEFRSGGLYWFAEDKEYSEETFGDGSHVYTCYINMTHPLKVSRVVDVDDWFWNEDEIEDTLGTDEYDLYGKDRYAAPLSVSTQNLFEFLSLSEEEIKEAIDVFVEVDDSAFNVLYLLTNSNWMKNKLIEKGYDGIIVTEGGGITFGCVSPEQIKLINNENPTSSNRIDESLLLEKTRNQLLTKSKTADNYSKNNQAKGKNRYERRKYSRIARSVAQYNEISMDDLFKKDTLQVGIQVQGETDNYIVQLRFEGVIRELAEEVKRNNGKLEFKNIVKAMSKVFNNGDVFINCSCPDYKYRQSYWATKQGYSIVPELRPSDITNPKDSKGGGCKHILLVLANLDWVMKISSVINNYIKYCQKNLQNAYATYIFPKVYGMPYQKAVQLSLFDDGLLPDDQETLKQVASQNIKNKNKSNLKKPEPVQKGFNKKEKPVEEPSQQEKSKTTGKSPLSTTDKYRYERDKNKEPKFTKQQSLFDMENEEQ